MFPIFLNASTENIYEKNYKPYSTLTKEQIIEKYKVFKYLEKGEEPQVFYSQNHLNSRKTLTSKNYIAIGHSIFHNREHNVADLEQFCKKIGAKLAIYSYVNSETKKTKGSTLLSYNENYNIAIFFIYKQPKTNIAKNPKVIKVEK